MFNIYEGLKQNEGDCSLNKKKNEIVTSKHP